MFFFFSFPAGIEQCHFIAWKWRDAEAKQGISGDQQGLTQGRNPEHCICDSSDVSAAPGLERGIYWSRKAVGRAGMLGSTGCQEQLVGRALVAPSCLQVCQPGLGAIPWASKWLQCPA